MCVPAQARVDLGGGRLLLLTGEPGQHSWNGGDEGQELELVCSVGDIWHLDVGLPVLQHSTQSAAGSGGRAMRQCHERTMGREAR